VKIIYVVTEDWYFCSHRLPVARAARNAGAEVIVATRVDRHGPAISSEGFRVVSLPWRRRMRNPFAEFWSIVTLVRLYRREKPTLVHHVAIKPTVYGGIAAAVARVSTVVNAIAGLGYLSTSSQRRARVMRRAVRWVFHRILNRPGSHVIVQNPDDAAALGAEIFDPARIHVIRGSGVDVDRFAPSPEPEGTVMCTMVARMVWSKGVAEMVAAARLLRDKGRDVTVQLVGDPDTENPETVKRATLEKWSREGVISWTPQVDDILPVWQGTNVAVLPTYREGLPKTLLEAAACARSIVATDVPGCREIVREGENGLLVAARDPVALAGAIETLATNRELRQQMGEKGRAIVEDEFAEDIVARETLALYRSVGGDR
jgi:glycosyltransferase involved in cell wall biosynthesis